VFFIDPGGGMTIIAAGGANKVSETRGKYKKTFPNPVGVE
jgi:hypothetical protein